MQAGVLDSFRQNKRHGQMLSMHLDIGEVFGLRRHQHPYRQTCCRVSHTALSAGDSGDLANKLRKRTENCRYALKQI